MDKINEEHSPIGTIITIMGVPKDNSQEAIDKIVSAVTEIANDSFVQLEIDAVNNTSLFTANMVSEADKEDGEFFTPSSRIAASLMHASEKYMDQLLDQQWAALSPEAKAAERKQGLEYRARLDAEVLRKTTEDRQRVLAATFDAAEKWAAKPDLTPTERCHGVAWEFRNTSGDTSGFMIDKTGYGRSTRINPGKEYATYYDERKVDSIQAKLARSAKELFN